MNSEEAEARLRTLQSEIEEIIQMMVDLQVLLERRWKEKSQVIRSDEVNWNVTAIST